MERVGMGAGDRGRVVELRVNIVALSRSRPSYRFCVVGGEAGLEMLGATACRVPLDWH